MALDDYASYATACAPVLTGKPGDPGRRAWQAAYAHGWDRSLSSEQLISDIHGAAPAFTHLMRTRSGEIRRYIAAALPDLEPDRADELAVLVAYPDGYLACAADRNMVNDTWWYVHLAPLARLLLAIAVRRSWEVVAATLAAAGDCSGDEVQDLLEIVRLSSLSAGLQEFQQAILRLVRSGRADRALCMCAETVRACVTGPLHLIGDLWDRGSRGDLVMDELMTRPAVDVQWGNHDICWMGAAAGDPVCITTCLRNNIKYGNLEQFEEGYGISLMPLRDLAQRLYADDGVMDPVMKAISVLLFKTEAAAVLRHPEWHMQDRLLFGTMNLTEGTVALADGTWPLKTTDFPTRHPFEPFALSEEEHRVLDYFIQAFTGSSRLQRQIQWLYDNGSVYKVLPDLLLLHGCVPLTPEGELASVDCGDRCRQGRDLLDWVDECCRRAWEERLPEDLDWMGYLWCGWQSTFAGRVVKTFERTYIEDKTTWKEPEDPYYALTREDPRPCELILQEFGCNPQHARIVNGHTPVKLPKGELPVRAQGKRLVIDGGFCFAYRKTTGIAGYTLNADADALRLVTHTEFPGFEAVFKDHINMPTETQTLLPLS